MSNNLEEVGRLVERNGGCIFPSEMSTEDREQLANALECEGRGLRRLIKAGKLFGMGGDTHTTREPFEFDFKNRLVGAKEQYAIDQATKWLTQTQVWICDNIIKNYADRQLIVTKNSIPGYTLDMKTTRTNCTHFAKEYGLDVVFVMEEIIFKW